MTKYDIGLQVDPPYIHRRNSEERAIQTCKNNFISGFSTTDLDFPIRKRDRLIFQCSITLNILRTSRVNPSLSAYIYPYDPYKFNKSPMAPPRTCVFIHDKHVNHMSWGNNGTPGWYIGPSLDHQIFINCYMPATDIVSITDTLKYTPK